MIWRAARRYARVYAAAVAAYTPSRSELSGVQALPGT
jgi:hypothetical protein